MRPKFLQPRDADFWRRGLVLPGLDELLPWQLALLWSSRSS